MKRYFLLPLFGLLPAHASQAAYPADFTAVYQLNKIGMNAAETRISLKQQDNKTWLYNSQTITKGLVSLFRKDKISEQTRISEHDGKPRPTAYQYIHKGSKKNRNRSITFDWSNLVAHTVTKGHPADIAINADVIDNFSLQLRIMDDLDSGNNKLEYKAIYKGHLKPYRFENLGREQLQTPLGQFSTLKIKRSRKGGARTTIMWLARELHYLPVKIQHIEKDGTDFSLNISQVSGPLTKGKTYGTDTDAEDE